MHILPTDLNDLARSYVDAVAILYFFLIFLPFHNTSLRTKDICILTVNKQHHITPHILYTKVGKRVKAILLFAITGFNFLFFNSIQFSKKTRQCLFAICYVYYTKHENVTKMREKYTTVYCDTTIKKKLFFGWTRYYILPL